MHWLDLLVLCLYGALVIGIGVAVNRRQKSTEDYFLGGRKLAWWAVAISILATSFSSTSLVFCTGWGFDHGTNWLQLQIGDLIGFGLVAVLFLPYFAKQPITTAYEYLERRFGVVARCLASLIFIVQTLVRGGLLVYAPALVVSKLFGWPIEMAIGVTAVAAIVYSAFGGIAAVVWTDLIQIVVIVVGAAVTVTLVSGEVPGGLSGVISHASDAGKLTVLRTGREWHQGLSLPWTLIAYGVLAISVQGTNQQAVQRYLSCTDLSAARRAAMTGWAIGAVVVGLTLLMGVCVWAWSDLVPGSFATGLQGKDALGALISDKLPAGVAGLMVAAVFAASMSSLDSAIHSISTAALVDFVRRFRSEPIAEKQELRLARILTVVFGLIAFGVAVYASTQGTDLLDLMVTWLGYFAGPMLGVFLLAMLTRKLSEGAAVAAVCVSFAFVAFAVWYEYPKYVWNVHALWLAPMATLICLAIGLAEIPQRLRKQ